METASGKTCERKQKVLSGFSERLQFTPTLGPFRELLLVLCRETGLSTSLDQ